MKHLLVHHKAGCFRHKSANIALHGMEKRIKDEFPRTESGYIAKSVKKFGKLIFSPTLIRYADDFVILCEEKVVIQRCQQIISDWLKGIGLELKPEKTRLTHTLNSELSEDGKAGFDFLGHHIQQYPAGKYRSSRNLHQELTGFITLITPSKKSSKAHQVRIGRIIKKHRSSPQAALIRDLNPVIRGWTSYYSNSDAQTTGELSKQDYLTYLKLRRWAKYRCGNTKSGHDKYWIAVDNKRWVFATKSGNTNFLRLLEHKQFSCSSLDYVKVKGDASPYDGNLVYWSARLGRHPELSSRKAKLLKQQKGICPWCQLRFREEDVLEVDHINPTANGGKDEWKNLQLLHRHCHDEKTHIDLIKTRDNVHSNTLNKLAHFWEQFEWEWKDDIPNYIGHKGGSSVVTKETY